MKQIDIDGTQAVTACTGGIESFVSYEIRTTVTASYEFLCEYPKCLACYIFKDAVCIYKSDIKNDNFIKNRLAVTLRKDQKYYLHMYFKSTKNNKINYKLLINKIANPMLEYFLHQWYMLNSKNGLDINILPVWQYTKGAGIKIAVADTGADSTHEALIKQIDMELSYNFVHDMKQLYPLSEGEELPASDSGHATHIAGIIGASYHSKTAGIAPEAKLVSYKILGVPLKENKVFNNSSDAFVRAIFQAQIDKINIINCSFGGSNPSDDEYHAMLNAKDILFIISAGNHANDLTEFPEYPACYDLDNSIVVTAVDADGQLCINSNYGERADIAAPGYKILGPYRNGKYMNASATSVAAPMVSGICALVWSVNNRLTPFQIKNIVTKAENTTYIENLQGKVKNSGMINAYKCVMHAINLLYFDCGKSYDKRI